MLQKKLFIPSLGARPSKNQKGGSGKRGGVEVFYGFCTPGTIVYITLVMQFSHCYCFASERKVTFAMLRPSCLMCQPFIIGSSVSQEMIHETVTTNDSDHSGFGSTESVHWK